MHGCKAAKADERFEILVRNMNKLVYLLGVSGWGSVPWNPGTQTRLWVPTFRNPGFGTSGARNLSGFPVTRNARARVPRNPEPEQDFGFPFFGNGTLRNSNPDTPNI